MIREQHTRSSSLASDTPSAGRAFRKVRSTRSKHSENRLEHPQAQLHGRDRRGHGVCFEWVEPNGDERLVLPARPPPAR